MEIIEKNLEDLKFTFEIKYLSDLKENEFQKLYDFIKIGLEEFKRINSYSDDHFDIWMDYFS